MMTTRRYVLRCRDPETYRSSHRMVSFAFVNQNDPMLIGNLITALATNIMRSWPTVYGVSFPHVRAQWDVITTAEAARL